MLERRIFTGGMNSDDEDRNVPQGDYRFALNLLSGNSESDGIKENIPSNRVIELFDKEYSVSNYPNGTNITVGTKEDKTNRKIYFLNYNSNNTHQVWQFDQDDETLRPVYVDSTLGFQRDIMITHIDVIDNDTLAWTDGYGEPKRLSIQRGLNTFNTLYSGTNKYELPLKEEYITAIKKPPRCQPTAEYGHDTSIKVNNLENTLYQFKYKFVYHDNSESSWSAISKVPTPLNVINTTLSGYIPPEIDNKIDITIDTGSSEVSRIKVVAREGNLGDFFLIEDLNKENSGIGDDIPYVVTFLNDKTYTSIEINDSNNLFNRIPKKAGTQSLIDGNRLVYGDVTEDFDQVTPSLEITPIYKSVTLVTAPNFTAFPQAGDYYDWRIKVTGGTVAEGQIYVLSINTEGPDISDTFTYITETGDTHEDVVAELISQINSKYSSGPFSGLITASYYNLVQLDRFKIEFAAIFNPSPQVTVNVFSEQSTIRSFKRGANHQIGIIYKDDYDRSSVVFLDDDTSTFYVQWFTETSNKGHVEVEIKINHTPPSWATHYHIAYSKNLNISDFLQFRAGLVSSVGTDKKSINLDTIVPDYLDSFPNSILVYGFVKGDRFRLRKNSAGNELTEYIDTEVLSYDSGTNNIVVADVSPNIATGCTFEIYTPRPTVEEKFFYEIGECYPVINGFHQGKTQNQTSSQPAIIVLSNEGDVYFKERQVASGVKTTVEDFNFSDFYTSNHTNIGRVNVEDIGVKEIRRTATFYYTESYVPDTNINGLGTVFGLSFKEYDKSYGPVEKTYSEDKRLIVYQELKTGQVLVNESVVYSQTGVQEIQKSDEILSDIIYYAGEYGIGRHPESFSVFGFRKYSTDEKRFDVLRLSNDGLTPISDVKMNDFFTDLLTTVTDTTKVLSVYDRKNDHLILSVVNENKNVAQQPGKSPPIELEGTTVVFSERDGRWISTESFLPENMVTNGVSFATFKGGKLYLHDEDSRNKFYDVQYDSEMEFIVNENPANMKVYEAIEVQSNDVWVVPEATNQFGQKTSLVEDDFENIEGVYWSALWKDENTPVDNPLFEGDDIRCHSLKIKLRNKNTGQTRLFASATRYIMSELTNR